MKIREYDPDRDRHGVRKCFVELQDFERSLDSRMPSGDLIADSYLSLMFRRCVEFSGVVLVADFDQQVAGFVTIWTKYRSSEPDDDPHEYGFISDLVVSSTYRRRGIGRSLLEAAETRARKAGTSSLQLSVKAGNGGAMALYSAEGFVESEIYLEKALAKGNSPAQHDDEDRLGIAD